MKYIIHYIFNCVIRVRNAFRYKFQEVLLKAFDRNVWDKIKINRAKGNRAMKTKAIEPALFDTLRQYR
jgi:hypothetical protein